MIRILFAFLATLALLPPLARAQDAAAEAIEGAWLVSVGEQPRDRFLIVKGAKTDRNEVRVNSASYGWIDGKGRHVGEWRAEISGNKIHLTFLTPSDSLIDVTFSTGDTSVSGEMLTKGGKKHFVRMTHLDAQELAAMRAAAAAEAAAAKGVKAEKPKGLGVTKNSNIYFVYIGASNCPSCVWFKGTYLDTERKKLREAIPGLDAVKVVDASVGSYTSKGAGTYPDELKWLGVANASGKLPITRRGVPFFVAVVDQRVIAQGHGTAAFEALIAPAIRRAVEEKRAAN